MILNTFRSDSVIYLLFSGYFVFMYSKQDESMLQLTEKEHCEYVFLPELAANGGADSLVC